MGCSDGATASQRDGLQFSLGGKADAAAQDIQFLEDIGADATVRGRFRSDLTFRGFTFDAEAGDSVDIGLRTQAEVGGLLQEGLVESELIVFAPSDDGEFTEVIHDTDLVREPNVQLEVEESGTFLVVATRPEDTPTAQFELNVDCDQCQEPVEPEQLCEPGRLFIDGATIRTQEWRHCQVIVLEPTRLPAEETLTIGPDVDVRAHYFVTDFGSPTQGETFIEISGKLEMESTKDHPIRFRSNVVDKQWVGLVILADGTELHDFQLIDAVTGIEISADGVRIADAEIRLAKAAIQLSRKAQLRVAGLDIERVRLRDNEKGISNVIRLSNGRLSQVEASEVFILDSEIALNSTGIDLRFVDGSFMGGLDVHHNTTGIRINNVETQTPFPDDFLILADSEIRDNEDGVSISGAGVLDGLLVKGNTGNGVAVGSGSQKVKNSLFKQNSADCDLEDVDNVNMIRSCGAVYTNPDAHTVLRNNVFKGNFGHGLVLEGRTTSNRPPRDPSVLNSIIELNKGSGILFFNAPIVSIEFNDFKNNGQAHMGFYWQFCTGGGAARTCVLNDHRIERNNLLDGADPYGFRIRETNRIDSLIFRSRNNTAPRNLLVPKNFYANRTFDELEAELDGFRVTFDPMLEEPEPQAGLVQPLDVE